MPAEEMALQRGGGHPQLRDAHRKEVQDQGQRGLPPGAAVPPVTSEMQGTGHMPTVSTGASSSLLLFPSRGPFPADTQDRNSSLFERRDKN